MIRVRLLGLELGLGTHCFYHVLMLPTSLAASNSDSSAVLTLSLTLPIPLALALTLTGTNDTCFSLSL
jgi:hypothetical protein